MQNGNPQVPPLPKSIRTLFWVANGMHFAIDEDLQTFMQRKNEFLADAQATDLFLTCDHRPIAFSRAIIEAYAFAKVKEVLDVATVEEPMYSRR